jgi:hypothetical protein
MNPFVSVPARIMGLETNTFVSVPAGIMGSKKESLCECPGQDYSSGNESLCKDQACCLIYKCIPLWVLLGKETQFNKIFLSERPSRLFKLKTI